MNSTEEFRKMHPDANVVQRTVEGIELVQRLNAQLEEEKRKAEEEIRETFAKLDDPRVIAYQQFYKKLGLAESHMRSQVKSILKGKQMPIINTLVDSIVIPELKNCILLGGHDSSKINGEMTVDVAGEGEEYIGIGGKQLQIPIGDIIVRDQESIIASITMGPCERTKLREDTKKADILAWTVPGIGEDTAERALAECEKNIKRFCS